MPGPRPRLTAEDLLSRYRRGGERTFTGVDLSEQTFRGEDLSDIDISDSDLRSTDLREANLTRANLTGCRMGRMPRWWLVHVLLGLMLSSLLGLLEYYLSQFVDYNKSSAPVDILILLTCVLVIPFLLLMCCFLFLPIRIIMSLLILFFPSLVVLLAFHERGRGTTIAAITSVMLLLLTWRTWCRTTQRAGRSTSLWKGQSPLFFRVGFTNLMKADLTDANLSRARLWGADFTGAWFLRTKFVGAIDMDGAWFGWNSDLRATSVEQLARTLDGSGKDFRDKWLLAISLAGTNLKGARMTRCVLLGADLSGAKLDDAELSGAYIDGQRVWL